MHQHGRQRTTESEEDLHILAHRGLKAHFTSPNSALSEFGSGLTRVSFIDEEELTAPERPLDLPVCLPVSSEFQAEGLRAVRVRHPLALLIAVTNDVSGLRTYYAIRSGANFVFNLAISSPSQIDMLYAQLRSHRSTRPPQPPEAHLRAIAVRPESRPGPRLGQFSEDEPSRHQSNLRRSSEAGPVAGGPPGVRPGSEEAAAGHHEVTGERPGAPSVGEARPSAPAVDEADRGLLRLLCSSMTVSEIARHHYCSERTMYRRIRKLYDDFGVRSRAELVPLVSGLVEEPSAGSLASQHVRRPAS